MKRLIAVLPLLLIIIGCSQSESSKDASVIASRSDAWDAALNAGDLDALVDLYTKDARVLAPNREMTKGSDGVRAEFGAMIDAGFSVKLTSVEVVVSDDIGYNVGTYILTSGEATIDVGKFIETWSRGDDGEWRIANDIYNSDRPAGAGNANLMILHEVNNADHWLSAWRDDDSRQLLFLNNGAAEVHAFQDRDNPHLTGLVINVSDMDALNKMLASKEGFEAARADGVRMDTIKVLVEAE